SWAGGCGGRRRGRVEIAGQEVTGLPPYRRPVNTVFQSYALFPHLDVFENVAFGLREAHVPRAELRRRVAAAISLARLDGRERARPNQLSGGHQQRAAAPRALVTRPEVLLLDEPLGALDLKLRKEMQAQLKDLQREVGVTFVYVTHDQEEAFSMSDRVAVMDHGLLEQVGRPEDVYRRPMTPFVASFVGLANQLAGRIAGAAPGESYEVDLVHLGRRPPPPGPPDHRPRPSCARKPCASRPPPTRKPARPSPRSSTSPSSARTARCGWTRARSASSSRSARASRPPRPTTRWCCRGPTTTPGPCPRLRRMRRRRVRSGDGRATPPRPPMGAA